MNNDLTVGNPQKVLWMFCLPLFGSIIFQQLYNIADSLVAGKFLGEEALAAVGNGYEITLIFIAFSFGVNIGCSVIASSLFGAKKYNDLKTAVFTTLIASVVLCAVLMLAGYLSLKPLLHLINTQENIFDDCVLYLNIYILGFPFVLFYNVANGIFSALGDSKTPFYFLATSSVANVIADIVFVACFKMGVAGVAWATFMCQGISCVLAVFFVFKRFNKIETEGRVKIFSFRYLGKISVIAIPSILQQSFISIGNIIIQGAINSFGSAVTAGYSASIKLNNLVITSLTQVGNGVSNYTAQNLGADKLDRVKHGFWASVKMVLCISVPIIVLYWAIPGPLVNLFMDKPSDKALNTGIEFLRIVSPFYVIVAVKLAIDGVLRGAGMMNKFMVSTLVDLILRVVLALILSRSLGTMGIWIAWPIGWGAAIILSIIFYRTGRWNHITPEEALQKEE